MSWSWSKSAGVARNASTRKSASLCRNSTLGIPAKSAAAPADKCPSSCSFMAAASRTLPSASEGEGPSARMVASGSSIDRVTPTTVAHAGFTFVRGSARVSDASGVCPTGRVRSRRPTLYRPNHRGKTQPRPPNFSSSPDPIWGLSVRTVDRRSRARIAGGSFGVPERRNPTASGQADRRGIPPVDTFEEAP